MRLALLRVREVDRLTECAIWALRRLPYREYLQTAHWQRVRILALDRARNICSLCPATTRLHVHHRSYARLGFEQTEDLIVLCADCHARHHRRLAAVTAPRIARLPPNGTMLPSLRPLFARLVEMPTPTCPAVATGAPFSDRALLPLRLGNK